MEPGEIVEITKEGIRTIDIVARPLDKKQAFCIFEYVYFARSDSIFEGQMVYSVRMQCGRQLAIEAPVDADIVSSVPESGTAAAHGYAQEVIHKINMYSLFHSSKILIFSLELNLVKYFAKTDMLVEHLFSHQVDYVRLA